MISTRALATLAIRQPGTVRAATIGHENEIFASASKLLHDSVAGESADGGLDHCGVLGASSCDAWGGY